MGSVYVCAGGTGGHVFPAIAVYEKIKGPKKFITDERGMRFAVEGVSPRDVVLLKTIRLKFGNIISAIGNIFFTFLCFFKERPKVVVCFGGIVTVIPAIVAKLFGARLIIHEQNIIMGRANRLLKIFADDVLLSYQNTKYSSRGEYAGMPVRSSIKAVEYTAGDKLVVSVIGGSQGSTFFSTLMEKVLSIMNQEDLSKLKIFHQSKIEEAQGLTRMYAKYNVEAVVKKFFPNMEKLYEETNLIIARAGSATLTEISIMKLPAILVPLRNSASNHQYENAKYYADSGACILLDEDKTCHLKVAEYLKSFLKDMSLLQKYHDNFANITTIKHGELILEKVNEASTK